jgi:hypothetical protein
MARDVRSGHPWPPLARRNLRFALRAALAFYARLHDTGSPERITLGINVTTDWPSMAQPV